MKIQISLLYKTIWGENLVLNAEGRRYGMQYIDAGLWRVDFDDPDLKAGSEYSFEVWKDCGPDNCSGGDRSSICVRKEWKGHRIFSVCDGRPSFMIIRDIWNDRPSDFPFYSKAFTDVFFKRSSRVSEKESFCFRGNGNVTFSVSCPGIGPDKALAITGSGRCFDDWQKPLLMNDCRFPQFDIMLDVRESFEYKFVIIDKKTRRIVSWEKGPNRCCYDLPASGSHVLINCHSPLFDPDHWRCAGTAVPVFSLRSRDSFGVGEFNDIKLLVDWAVATGQKVIQLLPVNDTTADGTFTDSYPYSPISVFALHPQYMHLPDAGIRADKTYRSLQSELNSLPCEDYERVNREKTRLLRQSFAAGGSSLISGADYNDFIEENKDWLVPYAAFCVLRDEYGTADFSKWGKYSRYGRKIIDEYCAEHKKQIEFYFYEQFCLDEQLSEVVSYAHSNGVILKGDLPIGVSRTGADVWVFPYLFDIDSQAGAPPDSFSETGQNWGFPTYNWKRMEEDGFSWWKARMKKMSRYFDAVRFDHILGFFRMWEIPTASVHGLLGHFEPALPYSAEELALKGFDMSDVRYSSPCLDDGLLSEIFGQGRVTDIKKKYIKDGKLRAGVSTQAKVAAKFVSPESVKIRDGLMRLLDEVLFVEDPVKKGYYHPRIAAGSSYVYKTLSEAGRKSFDGLYNDFFYTRHDSLWKKSAMDKLPELIDSTGMLACGEDLGMIPDCVPDIMGGLGILSLRIQRMPEAPGEKFADTCKYPYYSVCSTGTHDMETLIGWWKKDKKLSSSFFYDVLHCAGDLPSVCEPWLCSLIIERNMGSPSMLAVLPLQDWLSIEEDTRYHGDPSDERINVPSEPGHYWRYRMHPDLEMLLENRVLCSHIRDMVKGSGR